MPPELIIKKRDEQEFNNFVKEPQIVDEALQITKKNSNVVKLKLKTIDQ